MLCIVYSPVFLYLHVLMEKAGKSCMGVGHAKASQYFEQNHGQRMRIGKTIIHSITVTEPGEAFFCQSPDCQL